MYLDSRVYTGKNVRSVYRENRAAVVDIVRRYGPISKPDIARMTGLTTASATNIIRDLAGLGFIKEKGVGKSTGGRRAVLYGINGEGKYSICVDMSDKDIKVAVVDLAGRIVSNANFRVKPGENTLMLDLIHALDSFIKTRISMRDQILGIGVAVPGVSDPETGTVLVSYPLGWRNVPLKTMLSQAFGYPVFVIKETAAAILGEHYFGEKTGAKNQLYLIVYDGIGVGLMVDGKIYRGANGVAGEVGHTVIDIDGPECECGNRGCLERVASMKALAEYVDEMLKGGRDSILSTVERDQDGKIPVPAISQAARQGDAVAVEAIQRVAGYLAAGIVNLSRILDPDVIILSGKLIEKGQPLFEETRRAVERFRPILEEQVPIRISSLGESARLLGASMPVFEAAFERRIRQRSTTGREAQTHKV
ncbi:MAG TPA: ROK family transcriptional regulator [Firmicutes bacterium]|nr:ROK family transcriptional regulator [Bacillota bacterium]